MELNLIILLVKKGMGMLKNVLGWIPKIGLEQMCKDSYNFVKMHPNGLYNE